MLCIVCKYVGYACDVIDEAVGLADGGGKGGGGILILI